MYTIISMSCISLLIASLLSMWFVDSKQKLEAQLTKLESIQSQLWEVETLVEEDALCRNDAFCFCKAVEKSTIATYNQLVRQPRHFIPAKFYGYPTGLIGKLR